MFQPYRLKRRFSLVKGVAPAGKFHRHRDILASIHCWNQVERLENHADFVPPEDRETVFIKC